MNYKKLFKLHHVGDARFLLFPHPLQQIEMNIFIQYEIPLETDTLKSTGKPMALATYKAKPALIRQQQTLYGVPFSITNKEINKLFQTYRQNKQLLTPTVLLNIFF